ncbi:MAG: preprotein translocase subunit SecG, partial [Bdellovibrionaceae bacterium]|nr:preprotein translocase subunit SecG [Pseudobdellovibrionaceae bacterium]
MATFIAVVHILVAVILIALVLIQDSKGGGALGIGGG